MIPATPPPLHMSVMVPCSSCLADLQNRYCRLSTCGVASGLESWCCRGLREPKPSAQSCKFPCHVDQLTTKMQRKQATMQMICRPRYPHRSAALPTRFPVQGSCPTQAVAVISGLEPRGAVPRARQNQGGQMSLSRRQGHFRTGIARVVACLKHNASQKIRGW